MSKHQILMSIKRHCANCPLKCGDGCQLYRFRDGVDPDPRKPPTQRQLDALKMSRRRTDNAAVDYRREAGIGEFSDEL